MLFSGLSQNRLGLFLNVIQTWTHCKYFYNVIGQIQAKRFYLPLSDYCNSKNRAVWKSKYSPIHASMHKLKKLTGQNKIQKKIKATRKVKHSP